MVCPTCEKVYEGNFCPEFSLKTLYGRYTFSWLMNNLFFSSLHFGRKGLPHTIIELTMRPGFSLKKVLEGQRLRLHRSFKYLVLIGTIIIVLSFRYGFFHNEELISVDALTYQFSFIEDHKLFFDGFFKFAEDYATLLNLLAITVFSLFSYLFFKESGYNFTENTIKSTFISAQQLLFLILLVPFIKFILGSKNSLIPIYTLAAVLYNVWAYVQLYGLNVEPWVRYAIGILELIACMFLLIPSSVFIGTALSVILMTGALFFYLTVLSNSMQGDDGLLVVLALVTLSYGFSLLYFKRFQITIIRSLTKSLI